MSSTDSLSITKDSEFNLEWYPLDILFTHQDRKSQESSVWFGSAELETFLKSNHFPFKLCNLQNNTVHILQKSQFRQNPTTQFKSQDRFSPVLAIELDQTSERVLIVEPSSLMFYPEFFEQNWLIFPTRFTLFYQFYTDYFELKAKYKASNQYISYGEFVFKLFLLQKETFLASKIQSSLYSEISEFDRQTLGLVCCERVINHGADNSLQFSHKCLINFLNTLTKTNHGPMSSNSVSRAVEWNYQNPNADFADLFEMSLTPILKNLILFEELEELRDFVGSGNKPLSPVVQRSFYF
ncbi:MAG: hypothetical protein ACRCXZ_09990 [Patescibacteria group bacterium]